MATLTSNSLINCNSIPDFISTGTPMMFQQSSAPTSWTKLTTHDNKALRVVSGTATPGGTNPFTSVNNASQLLPVPSTASNTLSTPQLPIHGHTSQVSPWVRDFPSPFFNAGLNPGTTWRYFNGNQTITTETFGSSASHNHSESPSPSSISFDVTYVDVIIAEKD